MKKLIFVFMAIVAVSFASCGDKTTKVSTNDSVKVDSLDSLSDTINDTVTVDSIVK